MKFELYCASGFRGEEVWNCGRTDGRRTNAGVTGILLAHPWAFGSGELIMAFGTEIPTAESHPMVENWLLGSKTVGKHDWTVPHIVQRKDDL